jgi:hypothetical protein
MAHRCRRCFAREAAAAHRRCRRSLGGRHGGSSARSTSPRRGHVRAAARSRWSTSITGRDARPPRRSIAARQRSALPGRPAKGGRDHRRHARRRRRRARPPAARSDRDLVGARGCAFRRCSPWLKAISISAAALCSFGVARADVAVRSAWMPGAGRSSSLGSSGGSSSLSGRCSASSTVRHAAGTGRAKRQSGQKVSRPPARMDSGRRVSPPSEGRGRLGSSGAFRLAHRLAVDEQWCGEVPRS